MYFSPADRQTTAKRRLTPLSPSFSPPAAPAGCLCFRPAGSAHSHRSRVPRSASLRSLSPSPESRSLVTGVCSQSCKWLVALLCPEFSVRWGSLAVLFCPAPVEMGSPAASHPERRLSVPWGSDVSACRSRASNGAGRMEAVTQEKMKDETALTSR